MALSLEIVSPEKLLVSRDVEMVVMPGYEGDLAAMEHHAPMITLLRGGVIAIHENGSVRERYFVAGGFAELTPERCTILADAAVPVGALSADAAAARLREAERRWTEVDKMDVAARDAALDGLQSARAEVEAAA